MKRLESRMIGEALLIAAAGGAAGYAFLWLITLFQKLMLDGLAGYRPPELAAGGGVTPEVITSARYWLIPLSTTLGGLAAGALIHYAAPEAKGLATDETVKAYHLQHGRIRARAPLLKMLATAITLGSGGSAGREGTAAYVAGGLGSLYGQLTRRGEEAQRLLILVGVAAGIAAVFRCPIGAAFFAVEVLYSRIGFEGRALFYTLITAIAAYAIFDPLRAAPTLFHFQTSFEMHGVRAYAEMIFLGVLCGLFGAVLPTLFYRCRDAFESLPIAPVLRPAIGGLGTGCIGLALPAVLGAGYGWMQQLIDGHLTGAILIALLAGKLVTFILTVASGSSGGVFTPNLYMGAMLGGIVAWGYGEPTAVFAVVGMAALFAGTARVPIASLFMVVEMTGSFVLLVPAAMAVISSYYVQVKIADHFRFRHFYMHEEAP